MCTAAGPWCCCCIICALLLGHGVAAVSYVHCCWAMVLLLYHMCTVAGPWCCCCIICALLLGHGVAAVSYVHCCWAMVLLLYHMCTAAGPWCCCCIMLTPFHDSMNVHHHWRSDRNGWLSRTWCWDLQAPPSSSNNRLMNVFPGRTTLAAWASFPIRDSSSFLVQVFFPSH